MSVSTSLKRRGNVLLLSLFIMAAMLLGATVLATIIVQSLRTAGVAAFRQSAFTAAESGAERALWELRKQQIAPSALPATLDLGGGVSVTRTVATESNTLFLARIAQDDVYELALFAPGATPPAGGVARVDIRWDASCGATNVLELQNVTWTPGGGWSPSVAKFRYTLAEQPVQLSLSNPGSNAYRVRIRPERCDATNVRIDAFNTSGNPVPFPDRVTVVSTGSYAGTKQAIQVSVPLFAPLSGLFDFALFSECSIDKGGIPDCPGDTTPAPPPPDTNTNTPPPPPPPPPSGDSCPRDEDPYVCGDACTNRWYEYCDNGWMNGQAFQCNHDCTGYCGATPC